MTVFCVNREGRDGHRSSTRREGAIEKMYVCLGLRCRKGLKSVGKTGAAKVLRLRATRSVSCDSSVKRSAQDDGFCVNREGRDRHRSSSRREGLLKRCTCASVFGVE